ncbi:MAG: SDR family NAD(P)-dependent oxidoreductase [Gammaproteobacteria bacterium]
MKKVILVTGATDGIGLATAKRLVELGHRVLLHGRNEAKLEDAKKQLAELDSKAQIETYVADLSVIEEVKALATAVRSNHKQLDVLINNAGVYIVSEKVSVDGLDTRFVVNTIAPYLLTKELLPLLGNSSRVINLSSAAQAPINPNNLTKPSNQSDGTVYAQSKLAITMWSRSLALSLKNTGPIIIAVNPGSMLGSKMVKEAYGVNGKDIQIGSDILCRLALNDEFNNATGKYFDNDSGQITSPHPDALDSQKNQRVVDVIEAALANTLQ